MLRSVRRALLLTLCLTAPLPLVAQERDTLDSEAYAAERDLVQSALGAMVRVIRTATFRDEDGSISDRLRLVADQLNDVTHSLDAPTAPAAGDTPAPLTTADLRDLEETLNEVRAEIRALRSDLAARGDQDLAEQLASIESRLDGAADETRRLAHAEVAPRYAVSMADGSRWLQPGQYRADDDNPRLIYRETIQGVHRDVEAVESATRDRYDDDDWRRRRNRRSYRGTRGPFDYGDNYTEAYVGEFYSRWPYRETALYRPIPAIRYNRVEGLVLGARLQPLQWGDWEHAKLYGQVGYAFGLENLRYEVGAEIQPFHGGHSYRGDYDFDFKLGGSYRHNTATNDLWKAGWAENSLAALLFEYDYFDYYDIQGFTVYAVQRLSPFAQVSFGYRSDRYNSMDNEASWSLFGGGRDFRLNPRIDGEDGLMNSVVVALEGGQLWGMHRIPRGVAFRMEAELGEGLGGDYAYNRFIGDARVYLPVGYDGGLGFRLRGGYASDDAPFQKQFTLGGVGTLRAYPQNIFLGTRMLLGNVEYTIADLDPFDDIFDDLQVFGFAEAGWVNGPGRNTFDPDDLWPDAGVGISFLDRTFRLELAWPLRDFGDGRDPTLWFRISPTF